MNLLFCINQSFRPLLCQCLRSIVKNGGEEEYDAYILHSDLTQEDMDAIQAVSNRVHCRFVAVNAKDFEGFPESSRYPRQIFYRLAAPLLLPKELDRILYLDVDMYFSLKSVWIEVARLHRIGTPNRVAIPKIWIYNFPNSRMIFPNVAPFTFRMATSFCRFSVSSVIAA